MDSDPKPVLFNGGDRLRSWIEAGGSPTRSVTFQGLRLRWSAIWFDWYAAVTARKYAEFALPCDPTFIVGLWRTGSTTLHGLLADATQWTTPRTWQCFHPADFALAPPPRERHTRRPMDDADVGTFSPQEDEFAALLLGEPSVYRAFIDPRRIEELTPLLEQWREPADSEPKPLSDRWDAFMKAVCAQAPGPLLLKSPNHTFRLPWLATRFPQSRFIWLKRPISDVLASNRRMWKVMIERHSLWHYNPSKLEPFLQSAVRNHDELFDWAQRTIPERVTVVTFQELVQDTAGLAQRLRQRLELPVVIADQ